MAFMCPICDEPLTAAAPNYEGSLADAEVGHVLSTMSARKPAGKTGGGRGKKASTARSPIVVTPCGHLFHRVCLDQWFNNTGPRSCPSCRKTCAATKMVQAFPVISEQGQESRDNSTGEAQTLNVTTSGGSNIPVITITDSQTPSNLGNGGSSSAQNRVNPVAFEELKSTHATLIQDYNELTARYNEKVDEYAISQGIVKSYESSFEQLSEENRNLKHELSVFREGQPFEADIGSKNVGSTKQSASRKRTVLPAASAGTAAGSSGSSSVVPAKRARVGRPKGVQEKTKS